MQPGPAQCGRQGWGGFSRRLHIRPAAGGRLPANGVCCHAPTGAGHPESCPTRYEPEARLVIPTSNEPEGVRGTAMWRLMGSPPAKRIDHRMDGDRHERSASAHGGSGAPGVGGNARAAVSRHAKRRPGPLRGRPLRCGRSAAQPSAPTGSCGCGGWSRARGSSASMVRKHRNQGSRWVRNLRALMMTLTDERAIAAAAMGRRN